MVVFKFDKDREIRYGFKAMKRVKAVTGKNLMEAMKEIATNEDLFLDVMHSGLMSEDSTLTKEQVEEMLDNVNYSDSVKACVEAIIEAYGVNDKEPKTGTVTDDKKK